MSVEAPPGPSVFQQLLDKFEEMTQFVRQPTGRPLNRTIGANIVTPASPGSVQQIFAQPTQPAQGRMWDVRILSLFGADDHTTVASTGVFYCGAAADLPGPDFTGVVEFATAVPFTRNYGRRHIVCYPGETVYVNIYTPVASQSYTLVAVVDEYIVEEIEATRI